VKRALRGTGAVLDIAYHRQVRLRRAKRYQIRLVVSARLGSIAVGGIASEHDELRHRTAVG